MPKKMLFGLTVLILCVAPSVAADNDPWRLRVGGAWVDPSFDFDDDGGLLNVDSQSEFGLSVGLERKISRRLGIELGILHVESGFDFGTQPLGDEPLLTSVDTDLNMVTAALNIHLTPGRTADFYIGPVFAFVDFGETNLRQSFGNISLTSELRSDDDFALGAQVGADIAVGDGPWGIHLAASYIDSSLNLSAGDGPSAEVDLTPLVLDAGVSFRF